MTIPRVILATIRETNKEARDGNLLVELVRKLTEANVTTRFLPCDCKRYQPPRIFKLKATFDRCLKADALVMNIEGDVVYKV